MMRRIYNAIRYRIVKYVLKPDPLKWSKLGAVRHRSFDAMSGILAWMMQNTKDVLGDFDLKGKDVLEIGSGQFLVHAAASITSGANKVVTIDKFRQFEPELLQLSMEQVILARKYLSDFVDHDTFMEKLRDLKQNIGSVEGLKNCGIDYRAPKDIIETSEFDAQFDFTFSYTTLEHVPEPEILPLMTKVVASLKPGGVTTNFIDLEDHRDAFNDPFRFFGESEWVDQNCFNYGNRLRLSRWKQLLNEIEGVDWHFPYVAERNDAPLPERISPDVLHLDEKDLRIAGVIVVGIKR